MNLRRQLCHTIFLGAWFLQPATANEALDVLEGSDSSASSISVPTVPLPPSGGGAPDYDWRWLSQLPPLWSFYRNDDNPVVQEAALTGLFEWRLETGSIEADQGDVPSQDVDSAKARRARLGTVLRAFYNTDLEARAVFDGKANWRGVERLKATVHARDNLSVSFGKYRAPFGLEYSRDPSVRWFPEPSPLATQIVPANTIGAMASGYVGNWDFGGGWFSGAASENLPGIEGSGFIMLKMGYTFAGTPGGAERADEAALEGPSGGPVFQRWHLDYIYNLDGLNSASIPMGYRHLASTGLEISNSRFDFAGDFLLANGEQNTAWGAVLQGSYWLWEDAVRIVSRYTYADTDDEGGIMAGWGVPDPTSDSLNAFAYPIVRTGDELHTFYAGLNFHVIDDYVVLYTGVEYKYLKNPASEEDLPDFTSWLLHAGGRAAF